MSGLDIFGDDGGKSGKGTHGGGKDSSRVYCPHCKCMRDIVYAKRIENFQVIGTYPVCAVCSTEIDMKKPVCPDERHDVKEGKTLNPLAGSEHRESSKKLLDTLLNDDIEDTSPSPLLPELDEEVHFCSDCAYYLIHPFECRCCLHDRKVEPTGDCADFKRRSRGDAKEL